MYFITIKNVKASNPSPNWIPTHFFTTLSYCSIPAHHTSVTLFLFLLLKHLSSFLPQSACTYFSSVENILASILCRDKSF